MRTLLGLLVSLLGLIVAAGVINTLSNPSNAPLSLSLVEAFETYRFAFAWAGGALGTAIGAVLLLLYLALCFYLGTKLADLLRGSGR